MHLAVAGFAPAYIVPLVAELSLCLCLIAKRIDLPARQPAPT